MWSTLRTAILLSEKSCNKKIITWWKFKHLKPYSETGSVKLALKFFIVYIICDFNHKAFNAV